MRVAQVRWLCAVPVLVMLLVGERIHATVAPSSSQARAAIQLETHGSSGDAGALFGDSVFHSTGRTIGGERLIEVPGTRTVLALWDEESPEQGLTHQYAINLNGRGFQRPRRAAHEILLRFAEFDPLSSVPPVPDGLAADTSGEAVYIVQFETQPLDDFRRDIERLGGTVLGFLANQAFLVRMERATRDALALLPYVRWIGPHHPAYRLEEGILEELGRPDADFPARRYNILVFEHGVGPQRAVAGRILATGGIVHRRSPRGLLMEATLTAEQLRTIAGMNEVAFIDRWGPVGIDLDIAREISGANFIEQLLGFVGQGVRGEVLDIGFLEGHCDFNRNPILHTPNNNSPSHGTAIMGIVFGDGTCNSAARGLMPAGQPIFAAWSQIPDRFAHTAELIDPNGPYRAVFQTSSLGSPRTRQYTTISAMIDDILFHNDLLVIQTMSNSGNPNSRPEAWAKNIVSVGGVRHNNTLTKTDDCWCGSASTGPAADGRIKPDFTHFYDNILAPAGNCATCYGQFGGSSGATAIVAGVFGLFHQLWHEGVFRGQGRGATVFDSRPHATTAKAFVINTAAQYPFSGPGHDLSRFRQGWGMPDLRNMYDARNSLFIVDETEVLRNLQSVRYEVVVALDEPALRATLVFRDPPGNPGSAQHRINDLTLRLDSPNGRTFWGNNGLLDGNWSTPGGSPNTIDTVENVFVQNPAAGTWVIEVIADEINEDAFLETPEIDAVFALVVSGVDAGTPGDLNCDGAVNGGDIDPFFLALGDPAGYAAAFPDCEILLGDMNGDGSLNGGDIDPFFACLGGGVCP